MNKKHLVIGDFILDRFIYGDTLRVSAEAPTLVLDVTKKLDSYGGAYNVVAHLCSLGDNCTFVTVVGDDYLGITKDFEDNFSENCESHFVYEINRKTSLKTRLISNYKNSHLLRYDNESLHTINTFSAEKIIDYVKSNIQKYDTIILIDYKKGIFDNYLTSNIISIANKNEKPILVDTKRDDLSMFSNVSIIKPNKYEFTKIQLRYAPDLSVEDACKKISSIFNIQSIVITDGENGIFLYDKERKIKHINGNKVQTIELSGAGDSVLATIGYCISRKIETYNAVLAANKVASKLVSLGVKYRAKIEDL